jgi:two-component system chemotaxis sensor kinase CheA
MCSKIFIEDVDILKAFASSWLVSLKTLEKEILKLETRTQDEDLLEHILNSIHSIKIGSAFLGISSITRVTHEKILLLEAHKNQKLLIQTEGIDVLLSSLDFLNKYIKKLIECLDESNFSDEGCLLLFSGNEFDEGAILDSFKTLLEKNQETIEDNNDNEGLDGSQSEGFQLDIEGIKEQFLFENYEYIDRIENDLLIRLDANSNDRETIHEIFRCIHSMKGGISILISSLPSSAPGIEALKQFSEIVHTFESLLSLLRDKGSAFENNLVDLSMLVMDCLKSYMNMIAADEYSNLPDMGVYNALKEQVSHYQLGSGEPVSNSSAQGNTKALQCANKESDEKMKGTLAQSIRVNQEKIDQLMNMISELLVVKNSFMHISSKLNIEYNLPAVSKEVKVVGDYVNRISDQLQNAIMSIRMVEVKTVFQKMPRIIRDRLS